jgi:hypothetical protein
VLVKDELRLVTVNVNEPDSSLTEDEIDEETPLVNPENPGITDISNVTEPDKTPSAFILSFIVVLIELVNEFNDPVLVSIESTLFFKFSVVVATEDDKPLKLELIPTVVVATEDERLTIEPDKVFVVVATLELKALIVASILELKPLVVVATLELKEPILELKPLVVVATLELKPFVVVATLELKELIEELTVE